jgi:ATP phosphoribosyltransferase
MNEQSVVMENDQTEVRISLPSKGRLAEDCLTFFADCGLPVYKPNPRQYQAEIRAMPKLGVLFQRPADIVVSVRDGSVDFGVTGLDVVSEHKGENGDVLILHDGLNFGYCALTLAVPEAWTQVTDLTGLQKFVRQMGRPVRVATRYPNLTRQRLNYFDIPHTLISAEGTLETAPAIGYADMISDLVSSGQTLRDNRLRPLSDGLVQPSQAVLIANIHSLRNKEDAPGMARQLLEYFEAFLRGKDNLAVFANIRGESPEAIAELIFGQPAIAGLQGPTLSRVIVRERETNWYAVNIVVKRSELFDAINQLRKIGGSGVIVLPVSYIFDEEPPRYLAMLKAIGKSS